MSTPVDIWINIYRDDAVPSGGPGPRLFHRIVNFDHTPLKGDLIYIAHSDEDIEGTLGTYVYERFWTHDGRLILEMLPYHIDPTGLGVDFVDGRNRAVWRTDKGDLYAMLLNSGFEEC